MHRKWHPFELCEQQETAHLEEEAVLEDNDIHTLGKQAHDLT
jgi:hypothetical protein